MKTTTTECKFMFYLFELGVCRCLRVLVYMFYDSEKIHVFKEL